MYKLLSFSPVPVQETAVAVLYLQSKGCIVCSVRGIATAQCGRLAVSFLSCFVSFFLTPDTRRLVRKQHTSIWFRLSSANLKVSRQRYLQRALDGERSMPCVRCSRSRASPKAEILQQLALDSHSAVGACKISVVPQGHFWEGTSTFGDQAPFLEKW
jgi:hypothetical protein